jgi:hypothetical protein
MAAFLRAMTRLPRRAAAAASCRSLLSCRPQGRRRLIFQFYALTPDERGRATKIFAAPPRRQPKLAPPSCASHADVEAPLTPEPPQSRFRYTDPLYTQASRFTSRRLPRRYWRGQKACHHFARFQGTFLLSALRRCHEAAAILMRRIFGFAGQRRQPAPIFASR